MDLERMLERCRREQWSIDDLDWDVRPRPMPRAHEELVVRYFTDMARIELLAGALFREEERKVDDPTLKEILGIFVKDESRHAAVAERLARHYDVHGYRDYRPTPSLERFAPRFREAVRSLPPDIANAYITAGELILDIALLRSIDAFVHDEMSRRAMELINRDESRHIAIDYHMAEYYGSDAYDRALAATPRRPLGARLSATMALARMLWTAAPFIREVFFEPMSTVDPAGRRMREAWKRVQLLASKPQVKRRPFVRFMSALADTYRTPVLRAVFGPLVERLAGVPGGVLVRLTTDDEERRAARTSFDDLAQEALGAKHRVA